MWNSHGDSAVGARAGAAPPSASRSRDDYKHALEDRMSSSDAVSAAGARGDIDPEQRLDHDQSEVEIEDAHAFGQAERKGASASAAADGDDMDLQLDEEPAAAADDMYSDREREEYLELDNEGVEDLKESDIDRAPVTGAESHPRAGLLSSDHDEKLKEIEKLRKLQDGKKTDRGQARCLSILMSFRCRTLEFD